jgi:hypothetical protein
MNAMLEARIVATSVQVSVARCRVTDIEGKLFLAGDIL